VCVPRVCRVVFAVAVVVFICVRFGSVGVVVRRVGRRWISVAIYYILVLYICPCAVCDVLWCGWVGAGSSVQSKSRIYLLSEGQLRAFLRPLVFARELNGEHQKQW
jgi:hypothetical protein